MSSRNKPPIASDAAQRPSSLDDTGREAALLSIKQALVTSRLTLSESDAGADPYNRRQSPNPGAVWARRNRD